MIELLESLSYRRKCRGGDYPGEPEQHSVVEGFLLGEEVAVEPLLLVPQPQDAALEVSDVLDRHHRGGHSVLVQHLRAHRSDALFIRKQNHLSCKRSFMKLRN